MLNLNNKNILNFDEDLLTKLGIKILDTFNLLILAIKFLEQKPKTSWQYMRILQVDDNLLIGYDVRIQSFVNMQLFTRFQIKIQEMRHIFLGLRSFRIAIIGKSCYVTWSKTLWIFVERYRIKTVFNICVIDNI